MMQNVSRYNSHHIAVTLLLSVSLPLGCLQAAPPIGAPGHNSVVGMPLAGVPARAANTPSQVPPSAAGAHGKYEKLTFGTLAGYKYIVPEPKEGSKPEAAPTPIPNQIPRSVLALNGHMIEIEGFMVPMEVDSKGKVHSFFLARSQPMCCFGDTQSPNEWIDVHLAGKDGVEFTVDHTIKVKGRLEVGENIISGSLLNMYRMSADSVQE